MLTRSAMPCIKICNTHCNKINTVGKKIVVCFLFIGLVTTFILFNIYFQLILFIFSLYLFGLMYATVCCCCFKHLLVFLLLSFSLPPSKLMYLYATPFVLFLYLNVFYLSLLFDFCYCSNCMFYTIIICMLCLLSGRVIIFLSPSPSLSFHIRSMSILMFQVLVSLSLPVVLYSLVPLRARVACKQALLCLRE